MVLGVVMLPPAIAPVTFRLPITLPIKLKLVVITLPPVMLPAADSIPLDLMLPPATLAADVILPVALMFTFAVIYSDSMLPSTMLPNKPVVTTSPTTLTCVAAISLPTLARYPTNADFSRESKYHNCSPRSLPSLVVSGVLLGPRPRPMIGSSTAIVSTLI